MTQDDSRVVAWLVLDSHGVPAGADRHEVVVAHHASLIGGSYVRLVRESLLAEAESAANNLHTNLIAAYAERDALQSRLDAVVGLADKWEGVCTQMGGKGTSVTDSVITICVRQLRAALGGECRGDGEVGK